MVGIVSSLLIGFILLSVTPHQSLPTTFVVDETCVEYVNDSLSVQGSIILEDTRDDLDVFLRIDSIGRTSEFLPRYFWQFSSFYDSENFVLLFWIRTFGREQDSWDSDHILDVWSLETNERIKQLSVPPLLFIQFLNIEQIIGFDLETGDFVAINALGGDDAISFIINETDLNDIQWVRLGGRTNHEIVFNPDLTIVAYKTRQNSIVIQDLQSNQEIWFSTENPDAGFLHMNPAWSPNNEYLAFTFHENDFVQVALLDVDNQNLETIAISPVSNRLPELDISEDIIWSPDSMSFAFFHRELGLHIVELVNSTVIRNCVNGIPLFWIQEQDTNYLFLSRGPNSDNIDVINVTTNHAYTFLPEDRLGTPLGWSPLNIQVEG